MEIMWSEAGVIRPDEGNGETGICWRDTCVADMPTSRKAGALRSSDFTVAPYLFLCQAKGLLPRLQNEADTKENSDHFVERKYFYQM